MLYGMDYGPGLLSSDRFSRGEIEMLFSREGHLTDFKENFTIHLSGSKQWSFH